MEFQDILTMQFANIFNNSNSSAYNFTLNQTLFKNMLKDHLLGNIHQKESVAIGLVVLYIPAFIAGLLGNGFLTVVILSKRRLRNLTNIFLCNLAIADLSGKLSDKFAWLEVIMYEGYGVNSLSCLL